MSNIDRGVQAKRSRVIRTSNNRTNHHAIAIMFIHLAVCLSVWDGCAL